MPIAVLVPSMAPALVEVADIVEVDLDGNVHDAQGRRTYVERFIHSAIYKARADVMSVIHSHSPAVIPFGVTGARLRPITIRQPPAHMGPAHAMGLDNALGCAGGARRINDIERSLR